MGTEAKTKPKRPTSSPEPPVAARRSLLSRFRALRKTVPVDSTGAVIAANHVEKKNNQQHKRKCFFKRIGKGKSKNNSESQTKLHEDQTQATKKTQFPNSPQGSHIPVLAACSTPTEPVWLHQEPDRVQTTGTGQTGRAGSDKPKPSSPKIRRASGEEGEQGLVMLVVTLLLMILFGRIGSTVCLLASFYLSPYFREIATSDCFHFRRENNRKKEYKEKKKVVLLQGLLERNGRSI